jgi:hypothetical protein
MKKTSKSYILLAFLSASMAFAQEDTEEPSAIDDPPQYYNQQPEAPKIAEQVLPPPAPPQVSDVEEPSSLQFHLGVRSGLGVSALRKHKTLQLSPTPYSIRLEPAFSLSAGIAFAFEINSLFTLAPELQYTWYRANGEFVQKNDQDYPDLNEAGASLHSFELPILARFSFSSVYIELGPQVGYNYYAKIYKNNELKKPEINVFAFGPSIGGGVKITDGLLLGVRGYFGIFEYAQDTNGYPWAAQVSITHFFF